MVAVIVSALVALLAAISLQRNTVRAVPVPSVTPITSSSTASAVPVVTPTQSSTSASPDPSATPTAQQPAEPASQTVLPAKPTEISFQVYDQDQHKSVSVAKQVGVVEPGPDGVIRPSEATWAVLDVAAWWDQQAAPGNPSTGTSYIYGHACQTAPCAFNELHWLQPGNTVTVTTPSGKVQYDVKRVSCFTKPGFHLDPKVYPCLPDTADQSLQHSAVYDFSHKRRIWLITCGYIGNTSPINWAVEAEVK